MIICISNIKKHSCTSMAMPKNVIVFAFTYVSESLTPSALTHFDSRIRRSIKCFFASIFQKSSTLHRCDFYSVFNASSLLLFYRELSFNASLPLLFSLDSSLNVHRRYFLKKFCHLWK